MPLSPSNASSLTPWSPVYCNIYIHIHTHKCKRVCMSFVRCSIYIHIHVHHTCVFVCVCVSVSVYTCICTSIHICVCVYVNVCTHVYVRLYMYIYIYIHTVCDRHTCTLAGSQILKDSAQIPASTASGYSDRYAHVCVCVCLSLCVFVRMFDASTGKYMRALSQSTSALSLSLSLSRARARSLSLSLSLSLSTADQLLHRGRAPRTVRCSGQLWNCRQRRRCRHNLRAR